MDRLHERMGVEPTDQPVRHSIDSHPPRLLETEETKTVSIPFGDD